MIQVFEPSGTSLPLQHFPLCGELSANLVFLSRMIGDLTHQNVTMRPPEMVINGVKVPPQSISERPLVADATISDGGQNDPAKRFSVGYNYTQVVGGYSKAHLSPHLQGKYPNGGNVGMMDGHVEWRKFDHMFARTANNGDPTFWW